MSERLAVLGSPIAHSKSPALHRAAYGVLGLDWSYDAVEVQDGGLAGFMDDLGADWRGLSLTMPLKREVLSLLDTRSDFVEEVGAANTVLLREGLRVGFNTDVLGIMGAFREAGVEALESVQVLGAGATAASVLAAVSRIGATRVLVSARDPQKARSLEAQAHSRGIDLTVRPLGVQDRSMLIPDAVISTLPNATDAVVAFPEQVRREAVLFDVAYEPWPTALAASWEGTVIGGLSMLLHQAVGQVRVFTTGDPFTELDREAEVVAAMRAAVSL